jgi:hypothetical protein
MIPWWPVPIRRLPWLINNDAHIFGIQFVADQVALNRCRIQHPTRRSRTILRSHEVERASHIYNQMGPTFRAGAGAMLASSGRRGEPIGKP